MSTLNVWLFACVYNNGIILFEEKKLRIVKHLNHTICKIKKNGKKGHSFFSLSSMAAIKPKFIQVRDIFLHFLASWLFSLVKSNHKQILSGYMIVPWGTLKYIFCTMMSVFNLKKLVLIWPAKAYGNGANFNQERRNEENADGSRRGHRRFVWENWVESLVGIFY